LSFFGEADAESEIQKLADDIIKAQEKEIEQMKNMIIRLENEK